MGITLKQKGNKMKTKTKADKVDEAIGRLIREKRVKKGLSQQRLGDKIGVTFQQVQKYESGKNRVAASMLLRISLALDCGYLELIPSMKRIRL
jgi:transcriptional regulator with XRE-family HTH domain